MRYVDDSDRSVNPKVSYAEALKKQQAAAAPATPEAPAGSSTANNVVSVAKAASDARSSGAGGVGTLGAGMMAAGAIPSPASPYLIGGGLALSTLDQFRASKQAQMDAETAARNDSIKRQQEVLERMSQMFLSNSVM